jgi:hypothetical protein
MNVIEDDRHYSPASIAGVIEIISDAEGVEQNGAAGCSPSASGIFFARYPAMLAGLYC